MEYPKEIEISTMHAWTNNETIKLSDYGSENMYFIDKFDNDFFCKADPQGYENLFLQWFNHYLTVDKFAHDKLLSKKEAEAIIAIGKQVNNFEIKIDNAWPSDI